MNKKYLITLLLLLTILTPLTHAEGESITGATDNKVTAVSKVLSISVVLAKDADAVHQRIARVLETQLYQRCGARVQSGTGETSWWSW